MCCVFSPASSASERCLLYCHSLLWLSWGFYTLLEDEIIAPSLRAVFVYHHDYCFVTEQLHCPWNKPIVHIHKRQCCVLFHKESVSMLYKGLHRLADAGEVPQSVRHSNEKLCNGKGFTQSLKNQGQATAKPIKVKLRLS